MRHFVFAVCVVLMFAMAPYVRRAYIPLKGAEVVLDGSRDRALHGKARRRARRAAHGDAMAS